MNYQPKLPTEVNRVRITAWVPQDVADRLDVAAIRQNRSSSGYISAVVSIHCVALDLFAQGIDGQTIATMLVKSYASVMRDIGRQVDEAKGREG